MTGSEDSHLDMRFQAAVSFPVIFNALTTLIKMFAILGQSKLGRVHKESRNLSSSTPNRKGPIAFPLVDWSNLQLLGVELHRFDSQSVWPFHAKIPLKSQDVQISTGRPGKQNAKFYRKSFCNLRPALSIDCTTSRPTHNLKQAYKRVLFRQAVPIFSHALLGRLLASC